MSLSHLLLITEIGRVSQLALPSIIEHLCNIPTSHMYICVSAPVTEQGGGRVSGLTPRDVFRSVRTHFEDYEGRYHHHHCAMHILYCKRRELPQCDSAGGTQGHQLNIQQHTHTEHVGDCWCLNINNFCQANILKSTMCCQKNILKMQQKQSLLVAKQSHLTPAGRSFQTIHANLFYSASYLIWAKQTSKNCLFKDKGITPWHCIHTCSST